MRENRDDFAKIKKNLKKICVKAMINLRVLTWKE